MELAEIDKAIATNERTLAHDQSNVEAGLERRKRLNSARKEEAKRLLEAELTDTTEG